MDHFPQMLHPVLWDSIMKSVWSDPSESPLEDGPCGVLGRWGQGAWTHQPLYSRKPRPLGKRQPCTCRPQLGSFTGPTPGQYTPIIWLLWPRSTSDQHGGVLHFPSPMGEAALCLTANHSLCSFQKGRERKSYLSAVFSFTLPPSPHCVKTSTDYNFILVHF